MKQHLPFLNEGRIKVLSELKALKCSPAIVNFNTLKTFDLRAVLKKHCGLKLEGGSTAGWCFPPVYLGSPSVEVTEEQQTNEGRCECASTQNVSRALIRL